MLAKSRKASGYCVAGLELISQKGTPGKQLGDWIRPVFPCNANAQHSAAVPAPLCGNFSVLNVIEFGVLESTPTQYQPENWLAPEFHVNGIKHLTSLNSLAAACDSNNVWYDLNTQRDDQVSQRTISASANSKSLMFIQPENLEFTLRNDDKGKRNVLASFIHNEQHYTDLIVTDPAIERLFKNQFPVQRGQCNITPLRNADNYWLTLSLTPEYRGLRYVLVAAVVDHSGYINRNYH